MRWRHEAREPGGRVSQCGRAFAVPAGALALLLANVPAAAAQLSQRLGTQAAPPSSVAQATPVPPNAPSARVVPLEPAESPASPKSSELPADAPAATPPPAVGSAERDAGTRRPDDKPESLAAAAAAADDDDEPKESLPQVRVRVRVEGLEDDAERDNVEAWLGFRDADEDETLTEERARALHEAAPKAAATALEPFGYYGAQVTTRLEGEAPRYTEQVTVRTGTPVRWIAPDLVVEGAGADAGFVAEKRRDERIRPGRRLRHADYEAYKISLVSAARDDGYLDARLTRNVLRVDPAARTAQGQFTLVTGERFFFGPTRFEGRFRVRESLLRRYLRYQEGQPFSPDKVTQSQFAFTDADYFERIVFTPQRDEAVGNRVPVLVTLQERKSRRDSIGVGYGTDSGFRTTLGTEIRRLNRQGHKLAVEAQYSETLTGLSTTWRIPFGDEPSEFLSFTLLGRQEEYDSEVEAEDYKLGASLNQALGRWKRRYYVEFTRSLTSLGYDTLDDEDRTLRLEGETTTLVPGVSFSTTRSDEPVNAGRGYSLFFDVHGAYEELLSSTTFIQGRTTLNGVQRLPYKLRLLGRLELGATYVDGFAALPLEQRFFAGGDDSVRGYDYRALGVFDARGRNVGGKFVNTGSIELERTIKGPYGVAVFLDAGGVDDDPLPTLHYGAGIGARYQAPFGSVRIDLAHPFDEGEDPVRLHLGVRVGL